MLDKSIKWIMLVIGLITCSMILVAVSPQQGLMNTFGASLDGDLASIVTQSWGMLITITGGLLIYGAFSPEHRKLVIVAACVSKVWFVYLVLSRGQAYMDSAITAVVFDSVAVVVLLAYLFTSKSSNG